MVGHGRALQPVRERRTRRVPLRRGAERIALTKLRDALRDLQGGACFYCSAEAPPDAQVDHFVPWSRSPDTGIENLVLADTRCNNDKRDFFAASDHVARWRERAAGQARDLAGIAADLAWDSHPERTLSVARAIYLRLPDDAKLWARRGEFATIDRPLLLKALAS